MIMKTIKLNKKKDVHARKLGAEWLLYDPELEKLHILNPTAEFVWRLCDGSRDLSAIKTEMCQKYDIIDEKKMDEDLHGILKELVKIGILQEF